MATQKPTGPIIPKDDAQKAILEYAAGVLTENNKFTDYIAKMEAIDVAYARYIANKDPDTGIVSGQGLDAATRQKMLDMVKQQLNGEVELIEKVDPAVIGGFVLKIGDTQINRTIASQLAGMKKQLLNKELN